MSDNRTVYDDGQLPWLQAVEDEDEPRGVSARKMLAALGVVLLAGLLVAATFFWLGQRDNAVNGPPELIQAPPAPYKVKPPSRGGLDVAGESETARQSIGMPVAFPWFGLSAHFSLNSFSWPVASSLASFFVLRRLHVSKGNSTSNIPLPAADHCI